MSEVASRRFHRDARSVGAARHFALETARRWGVDTRDIALVVGELASNAVVHGDSSFSVRLRRDQRIVIEVSDLGPDEMPRAPIGQEVEHGRGLKIVDHLSTAWGVRPEQGGGKVVWARLDS